MKEGVCLIHGASLGDGRKNQRVMDVPRTITKRERQQCFLHKDDS